MVRPALLAPVENVDEHAARSLRGAPASTLTDNGRVYTARHVLAALNTRQNNGAPNLPAPSCKPSSTRSATTTTPHAHIEPATA